MRHVWKLVAAWGLVVAAVGSGPVMPAEAAVAVTQTQLRVPGTPEADGTPVSLDVSLWSTDPRQARPAIVLAHGFGGTKTDSASTARTLARAGYTVITYTARGFGRSGGLIHLDDPAFEGADAVKLVDLAAQRPEVSSVGGDPVIGFTGASYGGAVSLEAAALDPRVDAIAPLFTFNNLAQALFPQYRVTMPPTSLADVVPADRDGVFKRGWASLLFSGSSGAGSSDPKPPSVGESSTSCGRFAPALCAAYTRAAETGRPDPALLTELDRVSPDRLLDRVTAPTLIVAGEDDTLFPLDQADANLLGLPASTPARLDWVAGGHDGGLDVDTLEPRIQTWFDYYLRHTGPTPATGFRAVVQQTSLVGPAGSDREPREVSADHAPGRGSALGETTVALAGTQQSVLSPPGGTPAAITNLPGTGGAFAQAASLAGYRLGVLTGQSATFTSAPLTAPTDLLGGGRIQLQVTSSGADATLFAAVWDVGPDEGPADPGSTRPGPSGADADPPSTDPSSTDPSDGDPSGPSATAPIPSSAVLPGLAVAPVHLTGLTPGESSSVQVALPPVAHQVPVGHRLRVVVSSTDQAYATPRAAATYQIALEPGSGLQLPSLTAPVVAAHRLDVPLPLVIVVGLLVLAALAYGLWSRWRRPVPTARPDLARVPLVVSDLVKTYGDGFRAVDGVSFSAEAGQIVGLLGPNGAGKTTVMRMLVGLIRPDSGQVFVTGEAVHAGADVLGSTGAFIEGPGFLPHLTGLENLHAFWSATGRPLTDAHLEEALTIAALGPALQRRVRGYSQGMRQRLGIAQAMLGLPRLLVLDEPTNGLDPPQIKAMRTVLADYAATGRTVLVSSHLLAEVEHTCSHVVVMNRGRVVLTGAMAELTAPTDVTMIGLAAGSDLSAARAVLGRSGTEAEVDADQLRVTSDRPRADIVADLAAGGFGVESLDGRRQLEEVFLTLLGTGQSGGAEPLDQPSIRKPEPTEEPDHHDVLPAP